MVAAELSLGGLLAQKHPGLTLERIQAVTASDRLRSEIMAAADDPRAAGLLVELPSC